MQYLFKNARNFTILKLETYSKLTKKQLLEKIQPTKEKHEKAGFNMNGRFAVCLQDDDIEKFLYYIKF